MRGHKFLHATGSRMKTQLKFIEGKCAADWNRQSRIAKSIVLQVAALVLAFGPVAYFKL